MYPSPFWGGRGCANRAILLGGVFTVIVRKNSVLATGVYLTASTRIVNRETNEIMTGEVPEGSVVVPGSLPSKKPGGPSLYCAVIVKQVDEKTRSKTSINDLLRD